jgi:excisionase family DNA binding protein
VSTQWISVRQALALVPIGKTLMYKLVDDRTIRSTRAGTKILIDRASLDAYLASRARGGPQDGPVARAARGRKKVLPSGKSDGKGKGKKMKLM